MLHTGTQAPLQGFAAGLLVEANFRRVTERVHKQGAQCMHHPHQSRWVMNKLVHLANEQVLPCTGDLP